ncbi:class I SAM-dependent methyltransferase [Microbulbifer halophilus]|uniref:Methyltransferase n=1 Tax=Microbulbifer halophilus TaxID=453963 RepID=A0ABW5EJ58_9GAMM|nr:methyltransferase [Microbulbifer halophilus]MCW8127964.1 methyltransferase [Microbulbifer halophilus]
MTALLQQLLEEDPGNTLWIADENSKALLVPGFAFAGDLLTNRWDMAQLARDKVAHTHFGDFDFSELGKRYRRIVFPVSKEKAVVHHAINRAPEILEENGELILCGPKNSGIKTYAGKTAEYFDCAKTLRKSGQDYLSINPLPATGARGPSLDDSDYEELRPLDALGGLYSKPGLFGWNKIDTGSELLARQFRDHLPESGARVVDLGCGYGYLGSQLAALGNYRLIATDNNAAALAACARNFAELEIPGEVTPSDAGDRLESDSAERVICNPPFHQGFQVEGDLTDRFLNNAAKILKPGGRALFVVNEFIPLARKAQAYFSEVEPIAGDKGFRVYCLGGPL